MERKEGGQSRKTREAGEGVIKEASDATVSNGGGLRFFSEQLRRGGREREREISPLVPRVYVWDSTPSLTLLCQGTRIIPPHTLHRHVPHHSCINYTHCRPSQ